MASTKIASDNMLQSMIMLMSNGSSQKVLATTLFFLAFKMITRSSVHKEVGLCEKTCTSREISPSSTSEVDHTDTL